MYNFILSLHSIIRWLVLLAGVLAVGRAVLGWARKGEWTGTDSRLGLLFMISVDTQVLLGLLLYLFLSPITTTAFSDFGAAMSDAGTRFYLVEHSVLMIVSLGLVHMGRSLPKKVDEAVTKHKRAAIFFGLSLLSILAAIPWNRM